MKFFNYERIFIASHGNPTKLLEFFKEETEGPDWIVNPKTLVDSLWVTDRHKAEYLGLCALRNYRDYSAYGYVNLDLVVLPNYVPKRVITDNPLVTLTETEIIFKKENI